MIICHSVTDNTEKQALLDNISLMEENKENKSKVVVEVIEFGPLKITGNFIIKDLQRNTESAPGEIRLCRCGRSENKPYCDDSCKK